MFNKCSWGGTCFIFQFNSLFTDNLGLAEQCTKGGGPLNLYVYMYICIYVYMYICIYVYMYICIYVYMYICIYVYMYICIYVYMYMLIHHYKFSDDG